MARTGQLFNYLLFNVVREEEYVPKSVESGGLSATGERGGGGGGGRQMVITEGEDYKYLGVMVSNPIWEWCEHQGWRWEGRQ